MGFDIDLGNEMCKRMEVKCTWVGSDFDALIPSLKAKKIDAIISSLHHGKTSAGDCLL